MNRVRKIARVLFSQRFHGEVRIVPLCILSSSQIWCLCSPRNDQAPSAIYSLFVAKTRNPIEKRLQDWFLLLQINT